MCEIEVLSAVLLRMDAFEGVVLCHLVLPDISERNFRKYQMTEHHITEGLKFQRLCLYCGVDVPSSIAAHCVSTCTALSDLLSTFQPLWVSLKLPAGTSGYVDHLVKETIQIQLHLNSVDQRKNLTQAIHDSQAASTRAIKKHCRKKPKTAS